MAMARGLITGESHTSRLSGMVNLADSLKVGIKLQEGIGAFSLPTEVWDVAAALGSVSIHGFCFGNGGLDFYITWNGDYVRHYTLTKPYDMSTATLEGSTWDVSLYESNTYAIDISPDGKYFYITGVDRDTVNMFTLTGTPFNLGSSTPIFGYEMEDQYFSNPMTEADPDDSLTRSFEFGNNGTKLYTCGYGTDVINQYTLSTAYKIDTATLDGGYDMTGDGADTPEGIRWKPDGTKFFITDRGSPARVVEYSVSNAWDVTTGTITEGTNFSVSSYETSPYDVAFNSDGTRMYVIGQSGDDIIEYSLSVGYDLSSTVTYVGTSGNLGGPTAPAGFDFSPDGTKLAVIGSSTDRLYHYTLSTAWDLSTLSLQSSVDMSQITVMSQTGPNDRDLYFTTPMAIRWNDSGKRMAMYDGYGTTVDKIANIPVGVAYDASTLVDGYIAKNTNQGSPYAIQFKPDGTRCYMLDYSDSVVYQYSITPGLCPNGVGSGIGNDDGPSSSLTGTDSYLRGMAISPDGKNLFICGSSADRMGHYKLEIPWDVTSTLTFTGNTDITHIDATPCDFKIYDTPDGMKLFLMGANTRKLYSMTLNI